jgi:hypothetical protein
VRGAKEWPQEIGLCLACFFDQSCNSQRVDRLELDEARTSLISFTGGNHADFRPTHFLYSQSVKKGFWPYLRQWRVVMRSGAGGVRVGGPAANAKRAVRLACLFLWSQIDFPFRKTGSPLFYY